MTCEINSHDWPAFCRRITEQRAAATVKLEAIGPDGIKTGLVDGGALQSMTFDGSDPCNDLIILRVRQTREITHEILDPIQIRLLPSGTPGDFNPIEIVAENGTTLITLTPSVHARMLEGFKTL